MTAPETATRHWATIWAAETDNCRARRYHPNAVFPNAYTLPLSRTGDSDGGEGNRLWGWHGQPLCGKVDRGGLSRQD